MAKLLIQSMGCPNCGAPYEPEARSCRFCNSVLIVTSLVETFERSLAAPQVAASLVKWRQCLKEHPESAEAHFALGLSYLNSKLRDAALVHLRKAVLLAPEVADTHHNLAVTLLNDGNIGVTSPEYSEAVKEIDYSVQLAPDFGESVAFKHIFIARKLDAVDQAQALTEYSKAVEACPDIATLQYNLGMCYLNSKNATDAEICFQRAIDLDSGYHLSITHKLGHSNLRLGG
jgi:tetratricopeptide (TPR) repeat protein